MVKKKKNRFVLTIIVLALALGGGYYIYQQFFKKIQLKNKNYTYIFIDRNDTFEDVLHDINAENIIDNPEAFEWLAKEMDLEKHINPGKYRITNGMNMRQIINLIKYNKQEKVKLTYNSQIRTIDEFIDYTADRLELSASELESFLSDEKKLSDNFRLDPDNCFALVVPGIYEVSWAITANDLFSLLKERYYRIWNSARIARAKKLGFTVPEILTIASIVQCESAISTEQEKIAGVYFNRLKRNMPLQADPTLKYANRNFDIQRIFDGDKEIRSPYNTYLNKGLPPGPICLVTPQAIDATLNYKKHNFIFFCAKPGLNGFSDFSTTYQEHRKCAIAYQKALDKMGITR